LWRAVNVTVPSALAASTWRMPSALIAAAIAAPTSSAVSPEDTPTW
jgi:hypothetical protein